MLSVTGLFILYRYIKTVAKDSKIIQNYVLELESRVTSIEKQQKTINIEEFAKKQSIALNETEVDDEFDDEIEEDEDEDDNESIGSEDITNLLKKVMLGTADIQDDEDDDDVIEEIEVEVVAETCDSNEPEVTSNEVEPTVDHEDITISYKSDYKKMTLPELRKLLKEKNMVSKGTKSELIDRLSNC
jgi:hypothetical protein